ncbi:hypothetical protein NC653_025186 [Populus alba x Populus x berolinensis]|uniref:Uncharacterized protein n=1 Tax=Populus alba x Populus x berolinensis TaxID=444605 RepID=A0AAD6MAY7_9ROSI|nr:hypothetical protein NC653_025186 [Populus alba x Populus x berolinensis]
MPPSYIKLHLAIALNQRSGVQLSTPSWPSTLNARGNRHMPIMHNIWHTSFLTDSLMEMASVEILQHLLNE